MTNTNLFETAYTPREKVHYKILQLILNDQVTSLFDYNGDLDNIDRNYKDIMSMMKGFMESYVFSEQALENIVKDFDSAAITEPLYKEAVQVVLSNKDKLARRKEYLLFVLEGMLYACRFIDPEVLEENEMLDSEMDNIKDEIQEINELIGIDSQDGIKRVYQSIGERI